MGHQREEGLPALSWQMHQLLYAVPCSNHTQPELIRCFFCFAVALKGRSANTHGRCIFSARIHWRSGVRGEVLGGSYFSSNCSSAWALRETLLKACAMAPSGRQRYCDKGARSFYQV